jgi:polyhydroxyalkanoate synthesis regulator phasin
MSMKVLLEIKDSKAVHLMEVLKSLPYVKAKTITDSKAQLIEEIKEAVVNLNLVKKGKLKARPAKELINEL